MDARDYFSGALKVTSQMATRGAESAVYDCLVIVAVNLGSPMWNAWVPYLSAIEMSSKGVFKYPVYFTYFNEVAAQSGWLIALPVVEVYMSSV